MHGDQKDTAEDSLWLDGSLFLEVLENLLSNALRYAKSRVEITLDHKRETEMLFLYVHDDGPGFDEKESQSRNRISAGAGKRRQTAEDKAADTETDIKAGISASGCISAV